MELRPPRAELEAAAGMDAWIDTYHAIRSLTRHAVRVMVTDSAVGAQEENNLRHLVANLGDSVGRHKVIPFLTTKHSLEFCLAYADQAVHNGFPAIVVLGFWIVIQLISQVGSIAQTSEGGGVAYMAHIGGFVAGLVLVKLFTVRRLAAA